MKQKYIANIAKELQIEPQTISISLESEIKRLPFPELEILEYFYRLACNGKLVFCSGRLERCV